MADSQNMTEHWVSNLKSKNEKMWKEATLALGGGITKAELDLSVLLKALDSKERDTVFWCIGAIAQFGRDADCAKEKLCALVDHEYLAIRQSSIHALCRIAPQDNTITKLLVDKLDDRDPFIVCDALDALIQMDKVEDIHIEKIKKCLFHSDKHVAFMGEVALRNLKISSEDA